MGLFLHFFGVFFVLFFKVKAQKTSPCPTWTWSNSLKSQSSICFFNELEVFDSQDFFGDFVVSDKLFTPAIKRSTSEYHKFAVSQ